MVEVLTELVDDLGNRGDDLGLLAFHREGAREWTRRELGVTACALARGLLEAGLERGEPVGIFAANSAAWILTALAILRAGGVVVPLDAQLGADALRHELEDSGVRRLFTDDRRRRRVEELDLGEAPALHLLDEDEGETSWRALLRDEGELPDVAGGDRAVLFYTSGTTGPPKGVPLTHDNLSFELRAMRDVGLARQDDRVLVPLPLHHVYPFVVGMLMPLELCIPLVLPAGITGPQLTRALNEGEATLLVGVPRLYRALLEGIEARVSRRFRGAGALYRALLGLSSTLRQRLNLHIGRRLLAPVRRRMGARLRLVASAGSPLAPELAAALEGLGWEVAIGYGLTETSPTLTLKMPGEGRLDSVGHPIEGVELRIDPDVEGAEAEGEGEILVRGPNVFSGYHHLPEKTEEVLTEDGWFRTGDLGRICSDGSLQVLGRSSTLIVTAAGENIQPDEVEEAYAETEAIREVGVLQHDDRLVALVVPEGGGEDQGQVEERVREAVRRRSEDLPSTQRVSDIAISWAPLPRTHLGKIRRKELEERYERAQTGEEEAERGPIPIEEMPADDRALLEEPAARHVWDWLAERFPNRRLTPDSSLQLDLGVDSMEWIDLTMDLAQEAGIELDDEAIAEVERVRDLLVQVVEAREGEAGGVDLSEAPEELLDASDERWLAPLPPLLEGAARILYGVNRLVVRAMFRLRVEGAEHVPREGAFLLAANHVSFLDPFVLGAALPYDVLRRVHWGGWTGVAFGNPVTRGLSRLARAVPIDPQRGLMSSLAFGAAVLKHGEGLVWFPEGRRSETGELQPFRQGVGILLESQPADVVPAAIHGTHDAMPPGRPVPIPLRRVRVVFGDVVPARRLQQQGEGEQAPERIVEALHDRVEHLVAGT